ncbi:unnamed protein product [Polarella glacialis]|uniref:Major facilitator superfamily (MFS) profile domain-containing protein n=1 Tax=Polarella glacialis TaxID=89957 RepID=A0A813DFX8_POLGL|nr:unnamed protein product [Polarella glacialis]
MICSLTENVGILAAFLQRNFLLWWRPSWFTSSPSAPSTRLEFFLPALKDSFGVSLASAATIGSTLNGSQFFGSLVAGLLIPRRASHVTVSAGGGLMVLVGLTAMSNVENVVPACVAICIAGLGMGMSNLAGLVALNTRVVASRRALLVGLATCGTSVGTILLPQVYARLIVALGWRWSMRVMSFSTAFALLATAPFFRVPKKAEAPPTLSVTVSDETELARGTDLFVTSDPVETSAVHQPSTVAEDERRSPEGQSCWRQFPCADPRFACWWLNMLVCFTGYFAPAAFLAEFAKMELGLDPSAYASAYTAIGVGGLTTRLFLGFIVGKCGGPRRVHFGSQLASGVLTVLLPWCWNSASLIVWGTFYGLAIGPFIALVSVILSELFGTDVLPLYHGVSRTGVSLGTFIGPPLISLVVQAAGYRAALAIAGSLVLCAAGFLILLRVIEKSRAGGRAGTVSGQPLL